MSSGKENSGRLRDAEAALSRDEQRVRRLLQAAVDYIYTVRVEHGRAVATLHGPGCVLVTGYTPEEYLADPSLWIRMVPEEDRPAVQAQAEAALRGDSTPPIEHRIIHADGSTRWVKSVVVAHRNDQDEVTEYDGLINDITARKEAEELTIRQQAQLIQADKMATLGTLVSGVAHEINNPNNFILLNAKLIAKAWKDLLPAMQHYSEHEGDFRIVGMPYSKAITEIPALTQAIVDGTVRIQKIVQNLKDFARSDPGELNQKISINAVVEAAMMIVANLVRKSTDRFTVDLGSEIPPLRGNFQQLEQVVINLLTNACQALASREQGITVRTRHDRARHRAVIEVADTGAGIDPEQARYIFDPFYTTRRDIGGTGLGLAISYNMVKRHGGELLFTSIPGEGTVFGVVLPLP
ncbi:MAG TPA: ATP-binding protein [bacterium]|nr:ATP-binding protein [bacterium]HPR89248.1 ATP-binding protein [bacterium]